ncbi:NAD-dependent epimerase/dehydratase family protein [Kordiimonas sp. SCSIO 12610]|uniref:NAD-dependent epimerase/dehydratase family protein n=1 Tax=Kordiimonas sp. SCSIO 12610 TaxID=2829597 RepID=UPI00210D7C9D|nr:NAD-dependent epimerase/dehydratase family protein [Kordiimonas sp. SCSIO 12610]UTW56083.1 NAD-dependent epimerase/dehydratase family protein [Kordiimonas sp. SCSIO 12610]
MTEGLDKPTILITGVSGFIAKHTALYALNAGYSVRGTVRDLSKADMVKAIIARHGGDVSRLEFVEADLLSDDGWREAMDGVDYMVHTASPFPKLQPKDREALVPSARDGMLRAVKAALAAGVKRIVVTSSIAAIMYRGDRPRALTCTDQDWSDPDWAGMSAYLVSKTRAERALWHLADGEGVRDKITVINPAFVAGPALDSTIGTSLELIKEILAGPYPALPRASYPVADVRDVAAAHIKALFAEKARGRRLVVSANTLSLLEMAKVLKTEFPNRRWRIPGFEVPDVMIRALSLVDTKVKTIFPDMGARVTIDAGNAPDVLGMEFISAEDAVKAAAHSLIDEGVIR